MLNIWFVAEKDCKTQAHKAEMEIFSPVMTIVLPSSTLSAKRLWIANEWSKMLPQRFWTSYQNGLMSSLSSHHWLPITGSPSNSEFHSRFFRWHIELCMVRHLPRLEIYCSAMSPAGFRSGFVDCSSFKQDVSFKRLCSVLYTWKSLTTETLVALFFCLCTGESHGWRHYVLGLLIHPSVHPILMNTISQERLERNSWNLARTSTWTQAWSN